jgi:hypothetical protein
MCECMRVHVSTRNLNMNAREAERVYVDDGVQCVPVHCARVHMGESVT